MGGLGVVLGRLGNPSPPAAPHWPSGRPRPDWPQRDGRGRLRPAPTPPTGHLKPTWPSEAFGHLHPHYLHRPIGERPSDGEASPPLPTGHLLATPGPPPTPQTFGERWPKGRGGVFARKGGRYDVARVPYTPFGDPLPHRLTDWPLPATYGQRGHPSLATKGRGGGLCPATPPGRGSHYTPLFTANCKVYPQFRVYA